MIKPWGDLRTRIGICEGSSDQITGTELVSCQKAKQVDANGVQTAVRRFLQLHNWKEGS